MNENNQEITMPVNRLSYSGMIQLLRNPLAYKLKYILQIYGGQQTQSSMIGSAGHEALRTYYGGNPDAVALGDQADRIGQSIDMGMLYLENADDSSINYGKTGSREEMLKGYTTAMQFYFAEEPDYHEILMCEEKMEAEIHTLNCIHCGKWEDEHDSKKCAKFTAATLPLPATGQPDLVVKEKNGDVTIIDTKFVRSFTDYETEDYIKIVQAMFLYHLLRDSKGWNAKQMIFREIKRTKNKDGSPQVRDWAIPFNHRPYFILFYNLYKTIVKYLKNDPVFLPNLADQYDGEYVGLMYAQGLIDADMSDVEVVHKVRDVELQIKKFVPSRLDRTENQTLLPEEKIKLRLAEFGIPVEPVAVKRGFAITQYQFKVSAGIRMTSFKSHVDDIARALETKGKVRIVAPIPGTAYVGIEVENEERTFVELSANHLTPGTLMIPIGVDVQGETVKASLSDMPHLLVAGSTGSGKSVFINATIAALTKQLSEKQMQMVLIDPKRVELARWEDDKHLVTDIIYDLNDATKQLKILSDLMDRRYKDLKKAKKRDITAFNSAIPSKNKGMLQLVVVVDECADLILGGKRAERASKKRESIKYASEKEKAVQRARRAEKMGIEIESHIRIEEEYSAEDLIIRLAQMGRAAGIHLILGTQRPSVDVLSGLIKSNFPARVALRTASKTDSRVIIDQEGAETLAGKGDLLFQMPGSEITRLQGFFVK